MSADQEIESTPAVTVDADETIPAAAPSLDPAPSSYIDLDTATGDHVPHTEEDPTTPIPDQKEESTEDAEEEANDSEPLSDADEIDDDPADNQARMNAFLAALNFPPTDAAAAASPSAEDTEAFSETETATTVDPTQAAIAEVQEFLNRQAALLGAGAAAAGDSSAAATPAASASAATDRAARKAEFAAKVEARRREMAAEREVEEEYEEEEEIEEIETPASRAARQVQQHAPAQADDDEADEEEDEDEDEEEVDTSFAGWLKTKVVDSLTGKTARQLQSGSKWLTASSLNWLGRGLYVAGTMALVLIPLVASEMGEQNTIDRQKRLMNTTSLTEEQKQEIWYGIKVQMPADGAVDLTLA